ncbi:hypothetical protein C8A03DRAFT_36929 [Achaetomium macrosporum]|uniref:Uncharacterized protein n=1 Tax=Achaetomium macrosporum TaxID=79813 RepID=A0AAN7C5B6_9PEZI|nr:hypothetical protein C8A03DRAFT_36929 [Achaetomium macrosporum]
MARDLSKPTPTVRFTDVRTLKRLFELIDSVPGDVLYLTHVTPADAVEIDRERERCRRKFRFCRYYPDHQLLILVLPTYLHEALHLNFDYDAFHHQLFQLGLRRDWFSTGWATYPDYTLEASGRQSYGEGDSTGRSSSRLGPNGWPCLVIEGGHSQSLDQLHADLGWWFSASNHEVKIVVLLKFDRRQDLIIVEEVPDRPGAMTRSRAAQLRPVCRQSITISRDGTTDPVSYHVTGAPLVYDFRLLFLRDPGPGQGDITVGVKDLQMWASKVWSAVHD